VMNRPFSYSLNNPDHIDFLLRISDLGHDLGLHYVPTEIDREYDKEGIMKMKIAGARELLESKIGKPINSVSFHIPSKELINGSLIIGDMVNAYSKELMKNYISDSRGVWREGNPIDRNVYLILMFLGILILVKRRNRLFEILRGNIWVLLLFIFMGISITWSDFGDVAFKRWIKTTGALVMAFIVLSEREPLEAISTLLRRCFYIHLPLSIVFIKYFRTLGVDYSYHGLEVMWKGVTTHKNVLGQIVMSSGIYYIWNILRKPEEKRILLNTLFLLMTFWLMNGPGYSRSNTSIMVFFIGLLLLVLLNFAKSNIEYIRKYMVLGVFLLGFIYLISQRY